ncbi:MAG: hypothetical protein ACRDVG_02345 [Jatrophihabitantaceae bacterium]
MYEIRALNPDAINADLAYRRAQLLGLHPAHLGPRARWWRRRGPVSD